MEEWSSRFEKGKIYGLISRNEAGKTTVMKCISGIKLPLISTFLSRWEVLRGIRQKNGELFSYGNKIISIGDASYKIYIGEKGDDLFADPFHSQLEWSEIHALNMQGKTLYFRQDRSEGEYEIVALNVENGETKVVYK